MSKNRLPLYNSFFSELVEVQTHLEDYPMCKRHYNQLIASNYFHHHLLNLNSQWHNTKQQVENHDLETEFIEKQTCEIGIQVELVSEQVEKQFCEQLNKKIEEIEDLKKYLSCGYDYIIESWECDQKISQEKLFKKVVAVDAIYGSRHKNYVSEINLTLSAIKYSLARVKTIVDIDNHVISSRSYITFINWLESLAIEQEPIPEGLLFIAFDNEQWGQYNYLDRGYNTVIYHTVTSFVALNINKKNLVQFTTNPDILAALRAESTNESVQITSSFEYISITQKLEPDQNVVVPEMIGKNVPVVCDGVPYNLAQKIKKRFPWLVLIPGALYEEMNMLKAFVELNWAIDINQFAIHQGYRTENQLRFFKTFETENLSVNGYLNWVEKQDDSIYKLKFEQAIVNFRTGVRNNRPLLRNAARHIFAPIWSSHRHPIYCYIEVYYEEQLLRLHPEIRKIVESYFVISRSGYCNQYQGLDAILEEINKYLKALIPPVPSQRYWNIVAQNYTKFIKIKSESLESWTCPDYTLESQFESFEEEHSLSEQLKNFSNLACERRIAFIKKTFENNKSSLPPPIPVTTQEEKAAMSEENMSKAELLTTINSLLTSINTSDCIKYRSL
ncbi:hypothetical protein C2G38_2221792 [Gigaspora rosea]|uniref:Uncharacterized protein n=1 Tax=Gigaspora rosea TaxID=44941 RepID=A0A397UC21_9GLOM|nr:hypothetical protein C2G38_2221792 [Gigaspora rosea]